MLQLENTPNQTQAPQVALFQMITGYWISKSIYVAAKLGIADLLKEGARSYEQLAQATATDARSLYRLLRALASVGIFTENEHGYFGLTPMGACLQSDSPGSMRSVAMALVDEHFQAWGDFLYSIQTGNTAFEHVYGMPIFDYYMQYPEQYKIFDAAMSETHGIKDKAIVESYDFSSVHKLVDIGAGKGGLIKTILNKYPHIQGVIFDQAPVVANTQLLAELGQRLELIAGDFFETVPSGFDTYVLKRILHDWDDEKSLKILQNCRQAIADNGKLLVVESVIPEGNKFSPAKFLDLQMLALTGGMERTASEYSQLFAGAGFELTRIISTTTDLQVIEAIPV
jgi:cyclopropane fatty-acyl-phospholipid synthase-like methyltransferase